MPTKVQRELNQSFIDHLLKNMFYPLASFETEEFHQYFIEKIKALNPDSESFDTDWRHLLLGGAIAELVVFSTKYNLDYYPYTLDNLMRRCGANPGSSVSDEEIFACVDEIGRLILAKELPLETRHINKLIGPSQRNILIIFAEIINEYDLNCPGADDFLKKLPESSRCTRFFDKQKTVSSAAIIPVDDKLMIEEGISQSLC